MFFTHKNRRLPRYTKTCKNQLGFVLHIVVTKAVDMQHLMSEVHIAAMAALWPVLVAAPGIWKVKGLKIFSKPSHLQNEPRFASKSM